MASPGQRKGITDYYGAFLLDPDGNNIEACGPKKRVGSQRVFSNAAISARAACGLRSFAPLMK